MATAVKKTGRNDYSMVPVWELSAVVGPYVKRMRDISEQTGDEWSIVSWVAPIEGLHDTHVRNVLDHKQTLIPLHLVDLICHALGTPHLIHSFTFVPGSYSSYAKKMAFDEYVAEFNEDPPKEFLSRRAAELVELRERVLAMASFAPKPLSV